MRSTMRERDQERTPRLAANVFLGFRLTVWVLVGAWGLLGAFFSLRNRTENVAEQTGHNVELLGGLALAFVLGFAADRFFAILQAFFAQNREED